MPDHRRPPPPATPPVPVRISDLPTRGFHWLLAPGVAWLVSLGN